MPVSLKRAYEKPEPGDGHRVLVDRLWPRGIAKERARIDEWLKDAAPSTELRQLYHQNRLSWQEFRTRYLAELREHRDVLVRLAERSKHGRVTLVFSATDQERNNAVVLKQYLKMLGGDA